MNLPLNLLLSLSFLDLPCEIHFTILNYLSFSDLFAVLFTCSSLYSIRWDESFWKLYLMSRYPSLPDSKKETESWLDLLFLLLRGKIKPIPIKYNGNPEKDYWLRRDDNIERILVLLARQHSFSYGRAIITLCPIVSLKWNGMFKIEIGLNADLQSIWETTSIEIETQTQCEQCGRIDIPRMWGFPDQHVGRPSFVVLRCGQCGHLLKRTFY